MVSFSMRNALRLILIVSLFSTWGWGQDLVQDAIPNKWIKRWMPEELGQLQSPAYFTDLDKAKSLVFHGRYKAGLNLLRNLKSDDPQVALIQAKAMWKLGRNEEAIAILGDKLTGRVLKARILAADGKTSDAIDLLQQDLKTNPQSLEAHFYLGQIDEQIGNLDEARKNYNWFDTGGMRFLDKWRAGKDKVFDNASQIVLIGRAIDRLATLNSLYRDNRKLHDEILGMFVRSYDVVDRDYYPAHVAAAEYFLSHDQQKEALEELGVALEANPNELRALELRGQIALERFNFDACDQAIAAMRNVNENSAQADLLEARNLLAQRKPKEAELPLARVLKDQPQNIEALGLLAASQSLQLHDNRTQELLKEVEKIDPDNASAYFEVAEQLGAMRQYPRSAAMYQVAIDRAPWWTQARNGQGLLYTQSGDEDKARTVLDAAHALDPFNLKTTNYLRLLDQLGKFARKESAHFIVFYDGKLDPVIPEYFSDYLESVYKDVCSDFHHEPAVKTYIEVFPTQEAFSVRTTGSPWIGTVGASTGRVIALVSPRKARETMGTFNWSQVLRHEFTHTVSLSATDNRITHWMTEGLAVWEEHSPLRWEWVPMLYHAVKKHELFTMDGLTWGFVRPKRPNDRQLAYAQSFWICQYITDKYGHDAILKMMDGFKSGKRQEDVFPEVLGKSMLDFQQEFFAWAEKQVDVWGYTDEESREYDELKKKGQESISARQYDEAVKVWEKIAEIRPVDALPHQRLAGLYLTKEVNQPEKAIEHLIALNKIEMNDNRYAKRIARLYRDMQNWPKAIDFARQAVYINPYDADAHELLESVCEKGGDDAGAAREKKVMAILQKWQEDQKRAAEGANGPGQDAVE